MAIAVTYNAGTTTLSVTGGTSGAPATFADVLTADTANGWGVITSPIANVYLVAANLNIGDGTTATYFSSKNEIVRFADGKCPNPLANATFILGESSGAYGKNGTFLSVCPTANMYIGNGGTLLAYASSLEHRGNSQVLYIRCATVGMAGVQLIGYTLSSFIIFLSSISSLTLRRVSTYGCGYFRVDASGTLEDLLAASSGVSGFACGNNIDVWNADADTPATFWNNIADKTARFINPKKSAYTFAGSASGAVILLAYTFDLLFKTSAGTPVSGATVTLTDRFGTQVFSVTTGADGKIAQQIVTYERSQRSTNTNTFYSPHSLTVAKAGYETKTISDITISSPINWSMEALPEVFTQTDRDNLEAVKTATDQFRFTTANRVDAAVIDKTGFDTTATAAVNALTIPTVAEIQSGLALESTLTAIKGAGWTTQTLKAIADALASVGLSAEQIAEIRDGLATTADVTAAQGAIEGAIEAIVIPDPDLSPLETAIGNVMNEVVKRGPGDGSVHWRYVLTSAVDNAPIADAFVRVTTDQAGTNQIAAGYTDQFGAVSFDLDPGTVYLWCTKTGFTFNNPDSEVVA